MSFYSFFLSKNLVPINISENFFFFSEMEKNSQESASFPQKGEKIPFFLVILGTKKHH